MISVHRSAPLSLGLRTSPKQLGQVTTVSTLVRHGIPHTDCMARAMIRCSVAS